MPTTPPSIRTPLRKALLYLVQAAEQNLNEADTVRRVAMVLENVLGYDAMTEVTRECEVKGKYVDLAVKLDGAIRFLVEVKAAGTPLRDRHIDQARAYAADGNYRWVVLTNAGVWNLYHLTFDEGIEHDLVFSVDLGGEGFDEAADTLAVLHRDSIRKELHEDLWRKKSALSPQSIGRALFTESVIRLLRRELQRTEGISIDEEDLVAALKSLLSVEAREQMGPVKLRRKRRKKDKAAAAGAETPSDAQTSSPTTGGDAQVEVGPSDSAVSGDGEV